MINNGLIHLGEIVPQGRSTATDGLIHLTKIVSEGRPTATDDNTVPAADTTTQIARLETLISETRAAAAALDAEFGKIQLAVAMLPLHMIGTEQLTRLSHIRELKDVVQKRIAYLTRLMQRLY